jgi:hypothetical protein
MHAAEKARSFFMITIDKIQNKELCFTTITFETFAGAKFAQIDYIMIVQSPKYKDTKQGED